LENYELQNKVNDLMGERFELLRRLLLGQNNEEEKRCLRGKNIYIAQEGPENLQKMLNIFEENWVSPPTEENFDDLIRKLQMINKEKSELIEIIQNLLGNQELMRTELQKSLEYEQYLQNLLQNEEESRIKIEELLLEERKILSSQQTLHLEEEERWRETERSIRKEEDERRKGLERSIQIREEEKMKAMERSIRNEEETKRKEMERSIRDEEVRKRESYERGIANEMRRKLDELLKNTEEFKEKFRRLKEENEEYERKAREEEEMVRKILEKLGGNIEGNLIELLHRF
jgi:hypothetical protein